MIKGSRAIPSFRNDAPKGCSRVTESQLPVAVSCLQVVKVHPTEVTINQLISLAARLGDHEGNVTYEYRAVTIFHETRYFGHVLHIGHILHFGQTVFKGHPRF